MPTKKSTKAPKAQTSVILRSSSYTIWSKIVFKSKNNWEENSLVQEAMRSLGNEDIYSWSGYSEDLLRAVPGRTLISHREIRHIDFNYVDFSNCILREARFSFCNFDRLTDLYGALLSSVYLSFENCSLIGIDFSRLWEESVKALPGCFRGDSFPQFRFESCYLYNCSFKGLNLGSSIFYKNILIDCDFESVIPDCTSHAMMSEILRNNIYGRVYPFVDPVEDLTHQTISERRMIVELIANATNWCWNEFLRIESSEKRWAIRSILLHLINAWKPRNIQDFKDNINWNMPDSFFDLVFKGSQDGLTTFLSVEEIESIGKEVKKNDDNTVSDNSGCTEDNDDDDRDYEQY